MPSRVLRSARSFSACVNVRTFVTLRPSLGSGLQITTRRRFAMVCSESVLEDRDVRLLRHPTLAVRGYVDREVPLPCPAPGCRTRGYSARATRCRTSSLPFSLTGLPVMKSMASSSASESRLSVPRSRLFEFTAVPAKRFHSGVLPLLSCTDAPRLDPLAALTPIMILRVGSLSPGRRIARHGSKLHESVHATATSAGPPLCDGRGLLENALTVPLTVHNTKLCRQEQRQWPNVRAGPRVEMTMKRYKFQELLTLGPAGDGGQAEVLVGQVRRMVIHGHHKEPHASQFYRPGRCQRRRLRMAGGQPSHRDRRPYRR